MCVYKETEDGIESVFRGGESVFTLLKYTAGPRGLRRPRTPGDVRNNLPFRFGPRIFFVGIRNVCREHRALYSR